MALVTEEGDPDAFDITAERGEGNPLTFGAGNGIYGLERLPLRWR